MTVLSAADLYERKHALGERLIEIIGSQVGPETFWAVAVFWKDYDISVTTSDITRHVERWRNLATELKAFWVPANDERTIDALATEPMAANLIWIQESHGVTTWGGTVPNAELARVTLRRVLLKHRNLNTGNLS